MEIGHVRERGKRASGGGKAFWIRKTMTRRVMAQVIIAEVLPTTHNNTLSWQFGNWCMSFLYLCNNTLKSNHASQHFFFFFF